MIKITKTQECSLLESNFNGDSFDGEKIFLEFNDFFYLKKFKKHLTEEIGNQVEIVANELVIKNNYRNLKKLATIEMYTMGWVEWWYVLPCDKYSQNLCAQYVQYVQHEEIKQKEIENND